MVIPSGRNASCSYGNSVSLRRPNGVATTLNAMLPLSSLGWVLAGSLPRWRRHRPRIGDRLGESPGPVLKLVEPSRGGKLGRAERRAHAQPPCARLPEARRILEGTP